MLYGMLNGQGLEPGAELCLRVLQKHYRVPVADRPGDVEGAETAACD